MKKILFILMTTLSLQFSVNAQTEMLIGGTVNSIVDNLTERIKDVISELDATLSKQTFDINLTSKL